MKKIVQLFFTAIICASSLCAQNNVIDSLKTKVKSTTSEREKSILFSKIGHEYYSQQIYHDSAFYFTEKALKIAKDNNLKNQEARAVFLIGVVSISVGKYEKALKGYEEALLIYKDLRNKKQISSCYNNMGGVYFETGRYSKAITYYKKSLQIAQDDNDSYRKAVAYTNIGEANYTNENYEAARIDFKEALRLLKESKKDAPSVHLYYSRVLYALKEMNEAENEALLSFKISQENNDFKYAALSSELLSMIYEENKEFDKSLKYYKLFKNNNDQINEAKELNELEKSRLNFELEDKNEALEYLSQKNKYLKIIWVLIIVGIILLVILIFRQKKITRMTKNIHDIQKRLVETELNHREELIKNKNVTLFQVTKEQDREFFN